MSQVIVNTDTCEGEGTETQSKLIVTEKWWLLFYNFRNKLFNGKPILRRDAAPLIFMFVVLSLKFGCAIVFFPA